MQRFNEIERAYREVEHLPLSLLALEVLVPEDVPESTLTEDLKVPLKMIQIWWSVLNVVSRMMHSPFSME